jgi:TatD DNase family protein
MQLIDTHVHINFDVFQADIEKVRSRWQQAGVVRLIHSCVEPTEFSSIAALAQSGPRVVAIGETGLDFYKADNYEQQCMVFEAQLRIATELNLPVIIHCRNATAEVRDVLQKWKNFKGESVRGVMHCWGGTPEETQWFLDLGFYISFSGTVTFKNAKQIQASAAMVRSDRLLIETDCPFLAPVPKRGEKRNEPAYVRYVAEQIARLRGETTEAIAAMTTKNACNLFNLTL